MPDRRTVALDFDGTLHPYTRGWQGVVPDDEPPDPGAVEFLKMCATRQWGVVIFSCRASEVDGLVGIGEWIIKYGLSELVAGITHEKPIAFAYVDDRGVTFRGDWLDTFVQVEALADHPSGAAHRV